MLNQNNWYEDIDIFGHWYTWPDMTDPDSICHKEWIKRMYLGMPVTKIKPTTDTDRINMIHVIWFYPMTISKILAYISWSN